MDPLLRWLERSAFSVWTRESTSVFAYPAFLSAHAIGMGLVVGVAMAVALRRLGFARTIPPPELRRLMPLAVAGGVLNSVSGLILLVAYPTKALTNPVFYLKLALVAVGSWTYAELHRRLMPVADRGDVPRSATDGFDVSRPVTDGADTSWVKVASAADLSQDAVAVDRSSRWLAIVSLASWAAAITAGRLLAYTYHRLFVDF